MPLEPHEQRHVKAAEGYVELGMIDDAHDELQQVSPARHDASEVLAVRVEIYRALKRWDLLQGVAKQLAQRDPDEPQWQVDWAYATRRAESIKAARLILLSAVERQPKIAIFHYNLACYECQLDDLDKAKEWLTRAFALEKRFRILAQGDDDLKPLWDSLAADVE